MHGEDAQLADLTPQTIIVAVFDKPSLQALRRNTSDRIAIAAGPGNRYRVTINVGAEDFDVATERAVAFGHALTQKDGNGIDFLAG